MRLDIGSTYVLTLKSQLIGMNGSSYMAVCGELTKIASTGIIDEYQLHIGSLIVKIEDVKYAIKCPNSYNSFGHVQNIYPT